MRQVAKNRTIICSVVFVDVADYSRMSVSRQARVKDVLNAVVARAVERIPEDERFSLDTGDGAALCFVGDPEDALFVSIDLMADFHDAQAELEETPGLRVGVNLGPVRVAEDLAGGMNLIGDGINVAQRIMSFALPDQILVSRSYFEVVSCLSTRHASLFRYHGLHKDKHVREHVVYEVHLAGDTSAPSVTVNPQGPLDIEPERLADVQAYMTRIIGPLASILVPRAAERSPSEEAFIQTLALAVPEGVDRRRFVTRFAPLSSHGPPEDRSETSVDPHDGPADWTPAELEAITAALAREIGPLASVLVERAAGQCTTMDDLVGILSPEILDESRKARFRAAVRPRSGAAES